MITLPTPAPQRDAAAHDDEAAAPTAPRYVTTGQAMRILRTSRAAVVRLADNGTLPGYRIASGRRLLDPGPVDALARQLAGNPWADVVARRGHTNTPNRVRPSDAQAAVLAALVRLGGESWTGQLAADTGRDATNLARHTLPGLDRLGLIEAGARVQLDGGGRRALLWRITRTGRAVAAQLVTPVDLDEERAA